MSIANVTQTKRRVNASPETIAKSRDLDVMMLRSVAFVEGEHDTYQVDLETLTCTCDAARFGNNCKHAMAVIRRRVKDKGWRGLIFVDGEAGVQFAHDALHDMLGSYQHESYDEHGYVYLAWRRNW